MEMEGRGVYGLLLLALEEMGEIHHREMGVFLNKEKKVTLAFSLYREEVIGRETGTAS
jgi:hypothetical protein